MATDKGQRELVHAWLDGELDADGADRLLAALRDDRSGLAELEALERIVDEASKLPPPPLPDRFVAATMERIHGQPVPRRTLRASLARASAWAFSRRLEVRLSFAHAMALVVVVVIAALGAAHVGFNRGQQETARAIARSEVGEAELVRFALRAEDATQVELAGDFNGWTPAPLTRKPDGTFEAVLPLGKGRHEYAFRVDGNWRPDPAAKATIDDGFGGTNSVLEL